MLFTHLSIILFNNKFRMNESGSFTNFLKNLIGKYRKKRLLKLVLIGQKNRKIADYAVSKLVGEQEYSNI